MGTESITFVVIWKPIYTKVLSKHQDFFDAFIKELKIFLKKIMKGKNSHVFLLKKVGGALIRVGALNRDYTV